MKEYLDVVRVQLVPDQRLDLKEPIRSPEDAVMRLKEELELLNREVVISLNLSTSGDVLSAHLLSMGTIDHAFISVSELMRSCLLANANKVILMHNHPSGSLTPSGDDMILTNNVFKACQLMEIELLDHVIVGGMKEGFFSFRDARILPEREETLELPKTHGRSERR